MPWDNWGESIRELLHGSILGFAEAAWAFMYQAFAVGEVDGTWWAPVIGGTISTEIDGQVVSTIDHPGMLNVMIIAMLPVLVILVTFQLILAAVRHSSAGFIRAAAVAVFSVPATYVLAGIMWMVLRAVDRLTMGILRMGAGGGDSEEVVMSALLNLFGLTYSPETEEVLMDENYAHWAMAVDDSDPGRVLMPWLLMIIIWVLSLLLMAMMLFRITVVMLLAIFLPLAVFSLALDGAKAMFNRWVSVVFALIIAKPLAAAVIMFGMTLGAISDSWVQLVAGMIVILVAAALPVGLMMLVSFATGGASDNLERGASNAGRGATQRAMQPVRRVTARR